MRLFKFLLTAFVLSGLIVAGAASAQGEATIWTDKEDYAPEETVTIYGSWFLPETSVNVTVTRPDGQVEFQPDGQPGSWDVISDSSGEFETTYLLDGIEGVYTVVATDGTNEAETTFTDASEKVGSVAVGDQIPNPVTAGNSATYTITIGRGTGGGSSGAFTANLSVTTTLPTGASTSFNPNPVSFTSSQNSRTSTLTITTTDATPAGSTSFTVKATRSDNANDYATGTGTLVVATADTTPPVVTIIAPKDGGYYKTSTLPELDYTVVEANPYTVTETGWSTDEGEYTVTVTATDAAGNEGSDSVTYTVDNTSPVVTITAPKDGGYYRTIEPSTLPPLAFTVTDNLDPSPTILAGSLSNAEGIHTITVTATDAAGNVGSASVIYTVDNTPPVVTITAPMEPIKLETGGVTINASANVTESNPIETATWNWGDDSTLEGTITITNGSISVEGSHKYMAVGVYNLTLTVTDAAGNQGSDSIYVVIYDPSAGFVTGGGWINSPAGAYAPDTALTGKATFGFVSKYQKGAKIPTGNTEFQFHVAKMNFRSTVYEWLVIAGAKAQYKGSGTVNGGGDYGFMLSAVDAALSPSADVDLFRIKIWDKVTDSIYYDNQMGAAEDADPTTAIGGGSIVIHSDSSSKNSKTVAAAPALDRKFEFKALNAYPTPCNPEVWIPYTLGEGVDVSITIYSANGQVIRTLDLGYQNPGAYVSKEKSGYWDGRNEGGEQVCSGVYFYNIKAGDFTATRKFVVMR